MAFYTNLRPGHYRFQVEACNHHGYWSHAPASFRLRLDPHFYQTWPFYGLCVLGGLAGFGGWHLHRLQITRKLHHLERDRALEAERNRIARDLHDDLGGSLTGIALQIEAARSPSESATERQARLQQATRSIRAVVQRMREVIWSLNPQCDSLESFCAYLGAYAENFLDDAGIRCRLDLPEDVPPLPMSAEVRYHLLLVAKEALHNAAKHSGATQVAIKLRLERNEGLPQLLLEIADDGKGFDTDSVPALAEPLAVTAPPPPERGGCGLRNMRQRVGALGGSLQFQSRPAAGATLTLTLALNRP